MAQNDRQNDRHTDGHGDSMTNSAKRAELVKILGMDKGFELFKEDDYNQVNQKDSNKAI